MTHPTPEQKIIADWTRLGVTFGAKPSPRTPDIEQLIIDSARWTPGNSRLITMAVSWLVVHARTVGKHRLKRLVQSCSRDEQAVVGLMLESVDGFLPLPCFEMVVDACQPAEDPKPLFEVDRGRPAFARLAEREASALSKKWGRWCPPFELKLKAIRNSSWIMQANPLLRKRGLFKGSLKTSIIAEIQASGPSIPNEALLARSCGVTKKAIYDALGDLEYSQMIQRIPEGRRTTVRLMRSSRGRDYATA